MNNRVGETNVLNSKPSLGVAPKSSQGTPSFMELPGAATHHSDPSLQFRGPCVFLFLFVRLAALPLRK